MSRPLALTLAICVVLFWPVVIEFFVMLGVFLRYT